MNEFSRYGVASIDSTSPFQQSFKDDRDNYHTLERNYVAIRVMQIDGNLRLKRRILAGELDQNEGRRLELRVCRASPPMTVASLEATLDALDAYQDFLGESRQRADYEETLAAQPWKSCPCEVCADVGIQVAIFRGTEATSAEASTTSTSSIAGSRGTRDGRMSTLRVRTRDRPEPGRRVYSFGVDGKMLHRIAAISRVGRNDDLSIRGYQRPKSSRTFRRSARTSSHRHR